MKMYWSSERIRQQMQVSGQLHVLAHAPPGKNSSVPIGRRLDGP